MTLLMIKKTMFQTPRSRSRAAADQAAGAGADRAAGAGARQTGGDHRVGASGAPGDTRADPYRGWQSAPGGQRNAGTRPGRGRRAAAVHQAGRAATYTWFCRSYLAQRRGSGPSVPSSATQLDQLVESWVHQKETLLL